MKKGLWEERDGGGINSKGSGVEIQGLMLMHQKAGVCVSKISHQRPDNPRPNTRGKRGGPSVSQGGVGQRGSKHCLLLQESLLGQSVSPGGLGSCFGGAVDLRGLGVGDIQYK